MTSKSCPSTWLSAKVALAHLFPGALPPFLTPQSVLHTEARDIFVKLESAQNRPPHPPALRVKPCLIWLLASPLLLPCACHVSAQRPLSAPQIRQAQDPPQAARSFSVLSARVQPPLSGSVSALEPFSSTLTQADFSGPMGRGPTEASFAFAEQIRSCSK